MVISVDLVNTKLWKLGGTDMQQEEGLFPSSSSLLSYILTQMASVIARCLTPIIPSLIPDRFMIHTYKLCSANQTKPYKT